MRKKSKLKRWFAFKLFLVWLMNKLIKLILIDKRFHCKWKLPFYRILLHSDIESFSYSHFLSDLTHSIQRSTFSFTTSCNTIKTSNQKDKTLFKHQDMTHNNILMHGLIIWCILGINIIVSTNS